MKQVEVLLPTAVEHGFDYLAPEGIALGDIVRVPFGRGESLGVVWGEGKAKLAANKMKPLKKKLDFPPLSNAMRQFIDWSAWYNCAPKGAMLKMTLPIDEIEKEGRIKLQEMAPHPSLAKLSEVQRLAAQQLEQKIGHGFSVSLLDGVTGSGKTEVYFDAIAHTFGIQDSGSRFQEEKKISTFPESRIPNPESFSQALVLLPEIALSVQWLERFEKRFGFTPILWNSEVTPARKRAAWQAIARGQAPVVVGARSALFLPYRNLQLIVVDEEHDQSYKQEEIVIYHARDMAVARARFEQLPVVLVSATPSLETYHNARQGKYQEVTLPMRHAEASMPAITMLDMRNEPLERGCFISQTLRKALADTLASGHQSMLFLNRRGYAPLVLCRHCGHRFECPDCSSWMVLHGNGIRDLGLGNREENIPNPESRTPNPTLRCHHCNHRESLPKTCPACGKEETLHACGPGVERVLEEVQDFLPQARVAVMASDQLEGLSPAAMIAAMERKELDILIGTQMIAKGHHFGGLATVGVVDADLGLAGGDLRAAERTYQLLHQLSGRAGREQVKGRVYLQSYQPDHAVMQALISGDREAFLQAELAARQAADMPPFSRLAAIIVEGDAEEAVIKAAKKLAATLHVPGDTCHVLGPAPAPLYRLRGKYRWRLLIKSGRRINLSDLLKKLVESANIPNAIRVKIDIDPVSFL